MCLEPIGRVASSLRSVQGAPNQGNEGAPDAWLEMDPEFARAMGCIRAGDELLVFTWLHQARRDVREVHPRGDAANPLTGVFSTRSPDRPNPIGLHPVVVREVDGVRLLAGPIEAIDGTPIVDLKPVI